MPSPRRRQRRGSMEEPITMSSFTHLCEELNRHQYDFTPECNKHLESMRNLLDEFKPVYISSALSYDVGARMGRFGLAVLFVGLALFLLNEEVSLIVAAVGTGLAIAGGLRVAFGRYKKTQYENLKQKMKEELKGLQDKYISSIELMEKICLHAVEILRDAWTTEDKARALSDYYRFEQRLFTQEHDRSDVGEKMSKIRHLSGNLAEMISKVSSVPEILKEIIEDNKRRHDTSAKPTHQQIKKREKTEKFFKDMQKDICVLKNSVKVFDKTAEDISNL